MAMERKVGRWGGLFGQRMSFQKEILSAKEIGARWSLLREGEWCQLNVELDPVAGWLPPLWGSDDRWLYLRRPEGVWKCAIPDLLDGVSAQLRFRGADGKGLGSVSIGQRIHSMGGWFWSMDTDTPVDAADSDDEVQAWSKQEGAPADQLGGRLDQVLASEPGKTVVKVGDEFAEAPTFQNHGDWLVAADKKGWRVAYSLKDCAEALAALGRGELWLSFGSPWMRAWEVKVELASLLAKKTSPQVSA